MITFLKRLIKFTLVFLFVLLPLQLVGAVVLLFVLPFIKEDNYKLPYILRWFDNADMYVGRDTTVYRMICHQGWWPRYLWLAWRNPINYFGYQYTGLHWTGNEIYLNYDPKGETVGDTTDEHPGFRHIEVRQGDHLYFEYYLIYVYPFKKDVCCRLRMGWKIKDMNNPPNSISQWCFVISPWKKFSGKLK